MSVKSLLEVKFQQNLCFFVFFVKSQSKRPETGAYLENTTLLIPIKLGSQGLNFTVAR
jgi:hypothetical protein